MLFVTGGIAVGENRFSTSFNCPACGPGSLTPSTTSTHTVFGAGPAGGAGLEWMVLPNVSIKAEYLYVNLASLDSALIFNPSTANMGVLRSTVDNGEHVVRFGINYHFGAPTPLP
jgi:opacity protein-like surface antigen